jgi:hypothetical protein
MIKNSLKCLVLCSVAMTISACNSGGGKPKVLTSSVAQKSSALKKAANAADLVKKKRTFVSALGVIGETAWTGDSNFISLASDSVSLQEWFGDFFDPEFMRENGTRPTPMGKFKTIVSIMCVMGEGTTQDGSGLPTVGAQTVTLTDDIIYNCDLAGVPAGTVISATVTNPGGAFYQRQITMTIDGSNDIFLYGITGDIVQVAFTEYNATVGNQNATRVIGKYDTVTESLTFESIDRDFPGDYSFCRLMIDGATGNASILGHFGESENANYVRFAATGSISDLTTDPLALSVKWKGQTIADGSGEGCVNPLTGDLTSDGTLSCGSFTGTNVTGSDTMIENIRATTFAAETSFVATATTNFTFTNTANMLTTAP